MVTKAEIQAIDFNSNSCQVRIPILERLGLNNKAIVTAYFSITPGAFNSYKVGDVVIIGFECDEFSKPYVLGKLFTGINAEYENNNQYRGTINCSSINIEKSATLPANTLINIEQDAKDSTDNKNNINTLKDLINTTKQNSNDIKQTTNKLDAINPLALNDLSNQDQIAGIWIDGKPFYRHIYTADVNWIGAQNQTYTWSLVDLNFDNIWVNLNLSLQISDIFSLNQYYWPGTSSDLSGSDWWNTYITTNDKVLHYRSKTPADGTVKKLIIVVEYTKKDLE